jgi:hypothetical protein
MKKGATCAQLGLDGDVADKILRASVQEYSTWLHSLELRGSSQTILIFRQPSVYYC